MLADLFGPIDRGIAVTIFGGSVMMGPAVGPVVGGFIALSYLGWRWTENITAIMAFFFTRIAVLIVPETYETVLLAWRAKNLRQQTQLWAINAESEEKAVDIRVIAKKYLLRPFKMLSLEPILLLITLYINFVYGLLYMSFMAYPVSFEEVRGWNDGVGALPFLAVVVGVAAACVFVIVFSRTRIQAQSDKLGYVDPEERLIPMMVGGFLLPAGMLFFGWTSSPHITWVPQVVSGVFLGSGILLIFLHVRVFPNGSHSHR